MEQIKEFLTFWPLCKFPTPTWMDGALKQCSKVVSFFFSQSCYTLFSLQILSIQSCPLGQFSNDSIHHEDGGMLLKRCRRFLVLSGFTNVKHVWIFSSIHIRICENVFLIINMRWCKMKVKCLKFKKKRLHVLQKCAKNAQVQNNPNLKWGTCHNGCRKDKLLC